MRRIVISAIATVAGIASAVVGADLATASPIRPSVCDPDGGNAPYFAFSSKKPIYIRAKGSRTYGQSGIQLTISKGTAWTVGGSVTGTATAEAGALLAKASVSVAVSFQLQHTATTTVSASWTVPRRQKTGWLEVGTRKGYQLHWERYHLKTPCTVVVEKKGVIKAPTKTSALEFRHS